MNDKWTWGPRYAGAPVSRESLPDDLHQRMVDEIYRLLELARKQQAIPKFDGHMTWARACTVLGVSADASRADIRAAYLRLAKRYHPDIPGGDTDRMQLVNAAYQYLMT